MNADGNGPLDAESFGEWTGWMAGRNISFLMWSLSDKDETCSMLLPSALSEGSWPESDIKPWGMLVKETLAGN